MAARRCVGRCFIRAVTIFLARRGAPVGNMLCARSKGNEFPWLPALGKATYKRLKEHIRRIDSSFSRNRRRAVCHEVPFIPWPRGSAIVLLCALLLISPAAFGAVGSGPRRLERSPRSLGKIDRLTKSLEQTQVELAQSRTEIQQLRSALQEVLTRMNARGSQASPNAPERSGGS